MKILSVSILTLSLLLFCVYPAHMYAQLSVSDELFNILVAESWESNSYIEKDISGYELVPFQVIPFGMYTVWDYFPSSTAETLPARPEYALDRTYTSRTGGVTRGSTYSLDQIGRIYRGSAFLYGRMGLSGIETVSVIKKYGLQWFEGTPRVRAITDVFTSFRPEKMEEYRGIYREAAQQQLERVRQYEQAYDISIVDNPETQWVHAQSLAIFNFLQQLQKHPDSFNEDFRAEYGRDLPLMLKPTTPEEKARRSLFWQWARRKMGEVIRIRSDEFHNVIQPKGWVVSNIHGEDVIDFEAHTPTVDYPGPSPRPQFSDKELVRKYWAGYIFRLWRDLTDKPLYASPRINNGIVAARSIPTPNAVRLWYNQALQNGCVGFYQWLLDFAGSAQKDPTIKPYRGPCFANPDNSQLGRLRWETVLDIAKKLVNVRAFDPPQSETGILLSFDTVNIDGWKRVFSAYIELCKAGVWNGIVSDCEIMNGSEDLNSRKVLYVPVMNFTHRETAEALIDYVKRGGTLVCCDPDIFAYDMRGKSLVRLRSELFGVKVTGEKKGKQVITLQKAYGNTPIRILSGAHTIETAGADMIGTYTDGTAAVTSKKLGRGRAIYFAAPIADIYVQYDGKDISGLDGRYGFYKNLEGQHGITDQSWIWDITAENLRYVTGEVTRSLPPVKEDMILQ